MPDPNTIAAYRRRVQMYNDSLQVYNANNRLRDYFASPLYADELARHSYNDMPTYRAIRAPYLEAGRRLEAANGTWPLAIESQDIRVTNPGYRATGPYGLTSAMPSTFPGVMYRKPTPPAKLTPPVPRETLQRIEPRIPIPPSSFARTPISVPQPSYTRPSYRFTPGFVDPRVAASARQSAADGELLTREQLEYRNRVMRRQATPMTF
jgi:hypothetical protein